MNYSELNSLPAESFLHPDLFRTGYDHDGDPYNLEQYNKGLQTANEFDEVGILAGGTWYASKPNTLLTTYEGIGYHKGTCYLLKGLLDGKAKVIIHRYSENGVIVETRIK